MNVAKYGTRRIFSRFYHNIPMARFSYKPEVMNRINEELTSSNVTVFSKIFCPYCTKAKAVLNAMDLKPNVIELENEAEGDQIALALYFKTKMNTVPNIFIKNDHIGGFTELVQGIQSEELYKLLDSHSIEYKKLQF